MPNTKICRACDRELTLENFSRNPTRKDGLNGWCRECSNEYLHKHYKSKKQYYLDHAKLSKSKINDYVKDYKVAKGCHFCHENYYRCLEFHHLDGYEKIDNIGRMRNNHNINMIKEEMQKCIVVCANCHRKLHDGILTLGKTNEVLSTTNDKI